MTDYNYYHPVVGRKVRLIGDDWEAQYGGAYPNGTVVTIDYMQDDRPWSKEVGSLGLSIADGDLVPFYRDFEAELLPEEEDSTGGVPGLSPSVSAGVLDYLGNYHPESVEAFNKHLRLSELNEIVKTSQENDPINPNYYLFPNGVQTRDISRYLTSAGAQAVQYIVRATRLDGLTKEDPIQDINKAIEWLSDEKARLEETK